MKLWHDSEQLAKLENSDSKTARLLLGDDWRPLSEYVYDRRYVYAAAINTYFNYRCVIARGGKYETSFWWTPDNKEEPILGMAGLSVTHWKPLPEGVDAYNPLPHWEELTGHPWLDRKLREPEPEYEPASPTERLIPSARALLVAMRAGAVLRERGRDWSSFTLAHPGGAPEKVTARPIRPLLECVFIARNGTLPPRKDRWYEFEWKITEHGHAWLAANAPT
ncbi:hypothetical protein [Bradyrhizobium sp. Bra64]|uniref:hypothetical protein n=1 Tax=Bradyrhizobium sp. Bra64 TaxID=2926009 RepID=UPI0021189CC9|nr:hypothetical protein [Bradyrhizobium sp. Bra64]